MSFKKEKEEYNKLLKIRDEKIADEAKEIEEELMEGSRKSFRDSSDLDKRLNEAPCSVCSGSKFVLKYRDVNGKIDGEVSGYFSLFGGSISGHVDGNISTAPVLSCRNCGNERKIHISGYDSRTRIWKNNVPAIIGNSIYQASKWMKTHSLEALKVTSKRYYTNEYEDLNKMSDSDLQKVGLENKYPLPRKPNWFKSLFN